MLIVDDSIIVRGRLAQLLAETKQVEIVGEVDDAPQAMDRIRALKPQVVILDIRLPHGSGIDVLRDIKLESPTPIVIMLTNYPYPQYRAACLAAGADFFFDKSTEFNQLAGVIEGLVVPDMRLEGAH
jgi:DNA-binding NarL/FixJ family response regulator